MYTYSSVYQIHNAVCILAVYEMSVAYCATISQQIFNIRDIQKFICLRQKFVGMPEEFAKVLKV